MKSRCPHEYTKEILKTDLNSKIYETAGIMSAVLKYYLGRSHIPHNADKYEDHVWVKWAGTSPWMDNYNWIYKYFQSLCNRFEEEFGEEHFIWTKYAQVYYEPIQSYKALVGSATITNPEKYWDEIQEESNMSKWSVNQASINLTSGTLSLDIEIDQGAEFCKTSLYDEHFDSNVFDCEYDTFDEAKKQTIEDLNVTISEMQNLVKMLEKLKEPKI